MPFSIPAIMLALVAATATYLLFEAGDSEAPRLISNADSKQNDDTDRPIIEMAD